MPDLTDQEIETVAGVFAPSADVTDLTTVENLTIIRHTLMHDFIATKRGEEPTALPHLHSVDSRLYERLLVDRRFADLFSQLEEFYGVMFATAGAEGDKLEAASAVEPLVAGVTDVTDRNEEPDLQSVQELLDSWYNDGSINNDLSQLEAMLGRLGAKLVGEAILEHWGDRCPDFEPLCPGCLAWRWYDEATAGAEGDNPTADERGQA